MHLSVLLCMDPSMQTHIQERDVPMTCRLHFCIPISFFENMHYKVKCLPGFVCYVTSLVHPVSISSYDYSQVFTTACFQNFFVTKGVTLWNFNLSSRTSYCLSITGTYYHPIFYRPLPQGVQIILQLLYVIFTCDFPMYYTAVC